jgi:folate-binding protein YgfZ
MDAVRQQLDAFERGALLRDLPELATVLVTGADRLGWLSGMVTCEVASLAAGEGAYGLSVSRTGKIQAEVWVLVAADRLLLGVRRDLAAPTRARMDAHLIMEDAELAEGERAAWSILYGPRARSLAAEVAGQGTVTATLRLAEIEAALVVSSPEGAARAREALCAAGAVAATDAGWERIRIERLLPSFGVDFDASHYPQEAALEPLAVSFTKGCYLGQEAVFMLEKRGHPSKRLVRLFFDGHPAVPAGAEVRTPEGEAIGLVTASVQAEEHTLALGMLRYKHTTTGTEVRVGGDRAVVRCLDRRPSGCA